MSKIEKEYEEFMELVNEAGISDIMEFYNESKELLDICTQYLKEMDTQFMILTTDSTS